MFVENLPVTSVRKKLEDLSKGTLTSKDVNVVMSMVDLANSGKVNFKVSDNEAFSFTWEKNGSNTCVTFS